MNVVPVVFSFDNNMVLPACVCLSSLMQNASDTTFYILAVYFGSVGISRTRNAVTCGLIADFSGIIAAIIISYLFFAR